MPNTFRLLLFLLSFTCAAVQAADEAPPSDLPALVESANAFALELYAKLKDQPGNHCFSPTNLYGALALLRAGAQGKTAEQLDQALGGELSLERRARAWGELRRSLAGLPEKAPADASRPERAMQRVLVQPPRGEPSELWLAASVWIQQEVAIRQEFDVLAREAYGAARHFVDFKGGADKVKEAINVWAAIATGGRIAEALAVAPAPETRFLLAAATYLKCPWAAPFDPLRTKKDDFLLAGKDRKRKQVPFMHQTLHAMFFQNSLVSVLALPAEARDVEVLFLLPGENKTLLDLAGELNAKSLRGWLNGLKQHDVTVSLPRFKLNTKYDLDPALKGLGVQDAFSAKDADFSGITGARGLFLGRAAQAVYFACDERGVEAAAVDTQWVVANGEPPATFKANRPFLFLIRDTKHKALLFLGRMEEPD